MTANNSEIFVGSEISSTAMVSFVVLHLVCITNGVFGSILILLTLAKDRKLRPHTVTCSIYLANLVLPNLYFQLYFFPLLVASFLLGYCPMVSETHCAVTDYLAIACYLVYQFTLIDISFDRYMRVCHPGLHGKYFTTRTTVFVCLGSWVVGLLVPLLAHNKGRLGFLDKAQACITLGSLSLTEPWPMGGRVIGFAGPFVSLVVFVVIGALHLRILYAFYNIRRRVSVVGGAGAGGGGGGSTSGPAPAAASAEMNRSGDGTSSPAPAPAPFNRSRVFTAADVKLMRALLGVFLCMVLCYLPSTVTLLFFRAEQVSGELVGVFMLLFSLNSSVDWVVFAVTNSRFRRAYWRLLCHNRCCN